MDDFLLLRQIQGEVHEAVFFGSSPSEWIDQPFLAVQASSAKIACRVGPAPLMHISGQDAHGNRTSEWTRGDIPMTSDDTDAVRQWIQGRGLVTVQAERPLKLPSIVTTQPAADFFRQAVTVEWLATDLSLYPDFCDNMRLLEKLQGYSQGRRGRRTVQDPAQQEEFDVLLRIARGVRVTPGFIFPLASPTGAAVFLMIRSEIKPFVYHGDLLASGPVAVRDGDVFVRSVAHSEDNKECPRVSAARILNERVRIGRDW